MNKREKHEIACVVKAIVEDGCNEIRNAYEAVHGNLVGLRRHVRTECVAFWTDFEPYLDKKYLDISWMPVGKKIINYDDVWCFIRDGLKDELRAASKTKAA